MMALAQMVANGELDAEYIVADSEHSQLSIAHGASSSGARVFTGSSGVGVQFAYELYSPISGTRMPVQMMIADRTLDPPGDFGSEHTDALSTRDMGWLDGLVVRRAGGVRQPPAGLPDRRGSARAAAADGLPGRLLRLAHHDRGRAARHRAGEGVPAAVQRIRIRSIRGARCRTARRSCRSRARRCSSSAPARMEGAVPVIEQAHEEFARIFGRRYDPWIEEFMTDDAEVVFFLQGAHGVTARYAIKHMRERGAKVGLVRLKTIRPYPTDRVKRRRSASSRWSASSRPTWASAASAAAASLYAEVCAAPLRERTSGRSSSRSWPAWAARRSC